MKRECFCGCTQTMGLFSAPLCTPYISPVKKLSIVKCENPRCGFIFNDEKLSQEDFTRYYTSNDMYFYKRDKVSDIVSQTFQVLENFVHTSSSILDIGCGSGELLLHLKNQGFTDVHGLDTSRACIKGLTDNGVHMYSGEIFNNTIDRQFDMIILSHVVEHVYDLVELARILQTYMKPGGFMYVEVPDADMYHVDEYYPPFQEYNSEHINHFDEKSLNQLFMEYKLVGDIHKKVIQPQKYSALYGVFTTRKFCDEYHCRYQTKFAEEFKRYQSLENISLWGVGEFAYKLLPSLTNVQNVIDDNPEKIGKLLGNHRIISSRDFRFDTDVLFTFREPKMFVFDLDGTLIDSERIHYNALMAADWGQCSFHTYEMLLNTTGVTLSAETRAKKNAAMKYSDAKFIPGAEDMIDYVVKNNVNHVVVTNSSRETVNKFIEVLPKLGKLVNWVTREDYSKPKPDPECYLLAIEKFHKGEKKILGFENTLLGRQALDAVTDDIFMIKDRMPRILT